MKHKKYLTVGLLAAISTAATAQTTSETTVSETNDQIIVTATRIDQPIEQMGTSVEVVTSKQIEQTKSATLLDALRLAPGLNIRRSGASSLRANISVRGGAPETTMVMIDGVPIYDQAHLSGASVFDFGSMTADNIERIEVLKGAQSVLYGSTAMSGVINIVTKKGAGDPKASVFSEYGSYNTWHGGVSASGGNEMVNYFVGASFMDREGASATDTDTANERDGRENTTVQAKVGFTPIAGTEINLSSMYLNARGDFDANPAFAPADGTGMYQDQEQLLVNFDAKTLLLNDVWEPLIRVSRNSIERDDIDPAWGDTWFDSQTINADFQNSFFIGDQHTLIAGADWYEDTYEGTEIVRNNLNNYSFFGMYQLALADQWFTTAGIRHDDHSIFGDETTYQANSAYLIDRTGTRLHASLGTGFKAPNSYQLFAPATIFGPVGNPDLNAQTSQTWDVGIDQELFPGLVNAGVTYFHASYDDLIAWSPNGYGNIANMESQGVETYVEYTPVDNLLLKLSYTYTDNDADGDTTEYFIPAHEVGLFINYAVTDKWNVNLNGQYVDTTDSSDSYTLLNAATTFQLTENLQIYGRLTNLLDEDYELQRGYNEDRFGAYGGVKIEF